MNLGILSTILLLLSFIIPVTVAYGAGLGHEECYELGNCQFFDQPFNKMIIPYQTTLGGYTFVVIWGLIIGLLWLRMGNTMAVGIIGLVLAVLFNDPTTSTGWQDNVFKTGWIMLIAAIGIVVYQLFTSRVHYPTN